MSNPQYDRLPLVGALSDFGRSDVAAAGGKGANLGELTRSGFRVPPGFIVTTAAYDLVFGGPQFQGELHSALASLDMKSPDSVTRASQRIHGLVQQTAVPEELSKEVLSAYRQLKNPAVAVRSSATAEDLPGATFAGQQETILNVTQEPELIRAIRACWASLWSERAILYRAHQNIDQISVKLAVVVQAMIDADAAGVLFTADPVTGSRQELVIDASPGLGEAIVSGLVTPDHFVVNKRSRKLVSQRLGRREVLVRAAPGGGTEQITSSGEAVDSPSMPLPAILELARVGIEIEGHYRSPQDIEWAWDRNTSGVGKIHILQARPMTALPTPLKVSGPMRLVLPMLAEMWPTRPFPLDMTTFTGAVERAIGGLLVAMLGKSAPNPDEALLEEDGVVVRLEPPKVHPSPAILVTPWLAMWRTRHYDLSHWEEDRSLQRFVERARALEQRNPRELSWSENIETVQEALALLPLAMELREHYLPKALLGLATLWLLLWIAGQTSRFGDLISGIETKTVKTNEALESLAGQIRQNPDLRNLFAHPDVGSLQPALQRTESGRRFLQRFDEFLHEYGHRETTLTISQPAWKGNPESALSILKVLSASSPSQENRSDSWQHARDELLQHSLLGKRPFRGGFTWSLAATRYLFQIREDTHFYATMVQPPIRQAVVELGSRLVEAGALDSPEDVFHLTFGELQTLGHTWPPSEQEVRETGALIARRKAKREGLAKEPMVDPRLLSPTHDGRGGTDAILTGTSGSPGIARGPVRIVHDVSEFGKLRAGDVLVAPITNPAWTPLFQRAVAVVVDTGGAASHAAIVAREYGIPAVMGTVRGTQDLKDGQWIQVDGSRGQVLREEQPK